MTNNNERYPATLPWKVKEDTGDKYKWHYIETVNNFTLADDYENDQIDCHIPIRIAETFNPMDDFFDGKETDAETNAKFIVEACNNYQALLATQAKDREIIAGLVDLAEYFLGYLENNDFSNGVTDPTGSIDEGRVYQARDIGKVKAAINLASERLKEGV